MSVRYRATVLHDDDMTVIDVLFDENQANLLTTVPKLYDTGRVIVQTVVRNSCDTYDVLETTHDFLLDDMHIHRL